NLPIMPPFRRRPNLRATATIPAQEASHIAVVTSDESALPEVRQFLATAFDTTFLNSPDLIMPALAQVPLEAIILDIDSVRNSPSEGLETIRELRRIDQDLVLVALTRSHNRTLQLNAKQAGADEFFIAPVDFHELQIVLARSLEKRKIEIENRRLREQ